MSKFTIFPILRYKLARKYLFESVVKWYPYLTFDEACRSDEIMIDPAEFKEFLRAASEFREE